MSTCVQLTAYIGAHPALIRSRQDGTGDNEGRRKETDISPGGEEGGSRYGPDMWEMFDNDRNGKHNRYTEKVSHATLSL